MSSEMVDWNALAKTVLILFGVITLTFILSVLPGEIRTGFLFLVGFSVIGVPLYFFFSFDNSLTEKLKEGKRLSKSLKKALRKKGVRE